MLHIYRRGRGSSVVGRELELLGYDRTYSLSFFSHYHAVAAFIREVGRIDSIVVDIEIL